MYSPDGKLGGSQSKENMKTLKSSSRVGTSSMLMRPDGNADACPMLCEFLKHLDQRPPDMLSN